MLWSLLLAVLVGCVPRAPAIPPPEPAADVRYGPTLDGGLFLQGFDIGWETRPHRLSRLRVAAEGAVPGDADGLVGTLAAEVRGGTWASGAMASDTPVVTVRYGGLVGQGVRFVQGSTTLSLSGQIGRHGEPDTPAEGTLEVAVPLPVGVAPDAAVAVWLTGLDFSTKPSHPNGYTPHSLAVELGKPRVDGRLVRFTVYARFEAAPVLDRKQALAEYGSIVSVSYAVVCAPGGEARRFALRSNVDHGAAASSLTRKADPARVPVTIQGEPGLTTGVAGLSGFDVDLLVDGPVAGRYMRSLTVGLEDGRYDRGRGTYDALVALRFANSGGLPRPLRVEASADLTLLQLPGDADVREGRWTPPADGQAHAARYPSLEDEPVAATAADP